MLKNNSIMPGAYVSPAIRAAQLNSRRVVCTSPGYGDPGQAGGQGSWYGDDDEDY